MILTHLKALVSIFYVKLVPLNKWVNGVIIDYESELSGKLVINLVSLASEQR